MVVPKYGGAFITFSVSMQQTACNMQRNADFSLSLLSALKKVTLGRITYLEKPCKHSSAQTLFIYIIHKKTAFADEALHGGVLIRKTFLLFGNLLPSIMHAAVHELKK